MPKITLIVVNKRINQRFFVEDSRGQLQNPPTGCIIDSGLVCQNLEDGEEAKDDPKNFDFYMTPATATQGCILPTHFYVTKNESKLTKLEIQQLTYSLCHFYFNWAGPIKVPAPCQYAHKITEFYDTIGVTNRRNRKREEDENAQARTVKEKCTEKIEPLNKKLHFL